MPLTLSYSRYDLQFKFAAKTSRGSLQTHTAWYLKITDPEQPGKAGIGEAAPLAGLSIDAGPDFEKRLQQIMKEFNRNVFAGFAEAQNWLKTFKLDSLPAIKFGLETALLEFKTGRSKLLFDSAFSRGEAGIPINGLIWMGDKAFMQEQIAGKLRDGFFTLKLKIGGLDFETECAILTAIREVASPENLTIRLDANGAFTPENAMKKLEKLATYSIHSIEQPIKPGQISKMKKLAFESPIPIALDEELIEITNPEARMEMLETIRPAFIILKPTLVGGMEETRNWIMLAKKYAVGWWITSALESNIGLNAIAQFTATFPDLMPQGLGTGQLYHNNIASPLEVEKGYLFYRKTQNWQLFPD